MTVDELLVACGGPLVAHGGPNIVARNRQRVVAVQDTRTLVAQARVPRPVPYNGNGEQAVYGGVVAQSPPQMTSSGFPEACALEKAIEAKFQRTSAPKFVASQ